jgi:hypothetical protein
MAVVCLATSAATARAQASPSAGTAAISGVVVELGTGRPLENAVVSIVATPGVRAAPELTDAKGRFVFTDLPARDSYTINASKRGYFNRAYSRSGTYNAVMRLDLRDGDWMDDVRLELMRSGAIAGTVIDERGEPVVGAPVQLLTRVFVAGGERYVAGGASTTDDRGAYRIAAVTDGTYVVYVPSVQNAIPADATMTTAGTQGAGKNVSIDVAGSKLIPGAHAPLPPLGDGPALAYPMTFYPDGTTLAETTAIELRPGETREGIDIRLRPGVAWRINGRVEGPAAVIGDLTLRLVADGLDGLPPGSETASALVDKTGRFTFLNVPPGTYTIDARRTLMTFRYGDLANGFGVGVLPPAMRFSGFEARQFAGDVGYGTALLVHLQGDASMTGHTTVTVSSADVDDVVVRMQTGATISGRFVGDGPAVLPPIGSPSRNPVLRAEPADLTRNINAQRAVTNANDLTFTVSGLDAGRYLLTGGVPGTRIKSITANGRDYTYTPMDLGDSAAIGDVVVTLTNKNRPGIRGRVMTPASAGAAVIAFPVERELWRAYGLNPERIRTTTASTTSAFSLLLVPPGEYFVVAVDGTRLNAWRDPSFFEQVSSRASRVRVDWDRDASVDLTMIEAP